MTAIPIAAIARLNCFNRPIVLVNQVSVPSTECSSLLFSVSLQGACAQAILTLVPYTETRWRLIFGQFFALDIQICGPNLILVRDGAFSVQLNSSLPDLTPIPRLKVNARCLIQSIIEELRDLSVGISLEVRWRSRFDLWIHAYHGSLPWPRLPSPWTSITTASLDGLC